MAQEGLASIFPMSDLTAFGFSSVIRKLPLLRRRLRDTVDAVVATRPDGLILIDSFGFSFRVARRVREALPRLPIIKYVSPQVWVWRSGRAAAMRPYFNHTLALFPFEPEVHRRLGGPPCTYVGHPLIERLGDLRPNAAEAARRNARPPVLLVLPGSRKSEIAHLAAIFGEAIDSLHAKHGPFELILPTLPHLVGSLEAAAAQWPIKPRIVTTEAEKYAAMRVARAAIAASGTTTLELALSGVPHVGAYRVRPWEAFIARRMVQVSMALLPNLLLESRIVPELLQEDCTPGKIAREAGMLLPDGTARHQQIEAFRRLDGILQTGVAPSARAADTILKVMAG